MEDVLQRVFAVLISVIIFFFLPLYISFEKKDDISYSLALKITNNFVDNVTSKGYLTKTMYDKFVSDLAASDNTYDIKLEHITKKYYPAIYLYKITSSGEEKVATLDYMLYNTNITDEGTYDSLGLPNRKITYEGKEYKTSDGTLVISYDMKEIKYTKEQILDVIDDDTTEPLILKKSSSDETSTNFSMYSSMTLPYIPRTYGTRVTGTTDKYINFYTMSVGDEFTVIIQNTNVTIASSLFNMFTLGGNEDTSSRVYINYGGSVKDEQYKYLKFEEE